MTRILALIDGSVYARSVCDHARWIAMDEASSITIMHVLGRRDVASASDDLSGNLRIDTRDTLLAELSALDEERARLNQRRGRALLDEARARLQAANAANVTVRLRNGDLIEEIHELEPQTDLIVIGKRGEAADFARMHLGSNLERTVRATSKPVLVANRAFKPINKVLVAFDGGPSSNKAIDYLSANRIFAGLDVRVVTVGQETAEIRQRLDGAVAALARGGITAKGSCVSGQPDTAIQKLVADDGMDLLVMGAYGHSRLRNLVIGSTTTEMIRSCLIPIMLFR